MESCPFPCGHSSQDIGQVVILVKCKDACRQAPFVTGIATDHNRFIFWDFIEMLGEFPDIDMVGTADMADSTPVFDVPYIKDEGIFLVKTLL